jgi:hypothetical protein
MHQKLVGLLIVNKALFMFKVSHFNLFESVIKIWSFVYLQVQTVLNEMKTGSYEIFDLLLKHSNTDTAAYERINGARCKFEQMLLELTETIMGLQVGD